MKNRKGFYGNKSNMDGYKRFKDPVYGYIDIETKYVKDIIDTCEFQRLRRIMQTSYSSLYASSVHNRFIHSLGVYHLGTIASSRLLKCLQGDSSLSNIENWSRIKEIFDLSCLLHDVGHAPFSHTGEKYFLYKNEKNELDASLLHKALIALIGNEDFAIDIAKYKAAAPHEIVSAIVGIDRYKVFFTTNDEKEFFARSITGYKYSKKDTKHQVLNGFISLLNSSVIDVDRLDYIIRDAYFTGYKSTNIDYQRLLSAIVFIRKEDGSIELGYKKQAISIIESVVFAHDAERKWIQAHPVILYEMYILQHIMDTLDKKMSQKENKLFSVKTLSKEGFSFNGIGKIALFCDDDIIYLLKNHLDDALGKEFFERTDRRRPLWKSEAEYRAYFTSRFGSEGTLMKQFYEILKSTELYLRKNSDTWVIDDKIIEKVRKEKEQFERFISSSKYDETEKESFRAPLKLRKESLILMECLSSFSKSRGINCNFVVLNEKMFYSGFNKTDYSDLLIDFDGKYSCFGSVVPPLSGEKETNDDFFYIFYRDKAAIDKSGLFTAMVSAVMQSNG